MERGHIYRRGFQRVVYRRGGKGTYMQRGKELRSGLCEGGICCWRLGLRGGVGLEGVGWEEVPFVLILGRRGLLAGLNVWLSLTLFQTLSPCFCFGLGTEARTNIQTKSTYTHVCIYCVLCFCVFFPYRSLVGVPSRRDCPDLNLAVHGDDDMMQIMLLMNNKINQPHWNCTLLFLGG